ncbi:hypothetical protein [Mucilaginibacter sp.]|uniref:hypothetical protein n=1 Tax=Mucilaginibacter sp. TaxID=1882438 RepID=UPI002841FBA6|nr:hypothetical protein [Mucilaginibacter sp.]MDR3694452.1 hypothetical protein [Mucilaginibacter sp.]
MPYQRGDVIELPFLIPGKNKTEVHPAIIISNDMVYENEVFISVLWSRILIFMNTLRLT